MVYSDVLEVLEKADSDGRHLEDKMQKLKEFQGTGKLESWSDSSHLAEFGLIVFRCR